ncbi:MAG: hypothetical protein M3347_18585, partial [Armatimonadota bacterium]|nr:hypothetical protein [Armatimonadota bacterium]
MKTIPAKTPNSSLKNLDVLPKRQFHKHVWADYIEIRCLVNEDQELSKADIIDDFRERVRDLGEGESENDEADRQGEGDEDQAALSDKWEERANDWFRHLQYRAGAFGEAYPFNISADGDVLIAKSDKTVSQKLYIYLLFAANLRHIPQHQSTIAANFEVLSCEAIKACLPKIAEAYIFGTTAPEGSKFRGNLWKKVNTLAQCLHESVLIPEEKIDPRDSGDNGLDIVAWVPFDDAAGGLPIMFGQCACTDEWDFKQSTTSCDRWRHVISLT